jgi:hypothetical protein
MAALEYALPDVHHLPATRAVSPGGDNFYCDPLFMIHKLSGK